MEIVPGIGREELQHLLTGLVAKVDGSYHFVYWQVTRGTAIEAIHFQREMLIYG